MDGEVYRAPVAGVETSPFRTLIEFAVEYDGQNQCDCSPFRTVPEKRLVPAIESRLYALCGGALDSIGSSLVANRADYSVCSNSKRFYTSTAGRIVIAGFY